MSGAADDKSKWVLRVLGVEVPEAVESLSLMRLGKCRLAWVRACDKIHSEVALLQQAIIDSYEGDPAREEVVTKVAALDDMVSEFDGALADMLDEVMMAKPGAQRARMQAQAIGMAKAYAIVVSNDPDFALIEDNEYYPTHLRGMALKVLDDVAAELSPAA